MFKELFEKANRDSEKIQIAGSRVNSQFIRGRVNSQIVGRRVNSQTVGHIGLMGKQNQWKAGNDFDKYCPGCFLIIDEILFLKAL